MGRSAGKSGRQKKNITKYFAVESGTFVTAEVFGVLRGRTAKRFAVASLDDPFPEFCRSDRL